MPQGRFSRASSGFLKIKTSDFSGSHPARCPTRGPCQPKRDANRDFYARYKSSAMPNCAAAVSRMLSILIRLLRLNFVNYGPRFHHARAAKRDHQGRCPARCPTQARCHPSDACPSAMPKVVHEFWSALHSEVRVERVMPQRYKMLHF